MPNHRDLSKKYDISKARYRELRYFCLQYPEKKRRANDTYQLSAAASSGAPSSPNPSNPTERQAESQQKAKQDVDLIEKCVRIACAGSPGLYNALLTSVVTETKYEYMPVPCGRRQFYEKRREFFCILDREKG